MILYQYRLIPVVGIRGLLKGLAISVVGDPSVCSSSAVTKLAEGGLKRQRSSFRYGVPSATSLAQHIKATGGGLGPKFEIVLFLIS